jgi:glycosyltransferase involved in cell wall biosynthesis
MVAPQPFYEDRGTPIALRHVLEALSADGHEVDLLTFPGGTDVAIAGLRVFRAGGFFSRRRVRIGFSLRKLLLDVFLVLALLRRLNSRDYSCVHAVEEMIFPALILGRLRGVPVIYDMQSSLPDQLRSHSVLGKDRVQRWLLSAERWAFRHSAVVACSAGLAQYVHRAAPATEVLEWNFPGQSSTISQKSIAAQKEACGIPANAPIVLYAGNFAPYQGVTWLVQAILHVLREVPGAVLVLVGADDRPMPADLRDAAAQVPREALIILPRQPREALPSFIAMADVLVSPRAGGDNLPLKVFDYIAAGKAIVATDFPIHRTVLNEERAMLVEPEAAAMARGIVTVLTDQSLARRLAAAARAHSDANYSLVAFRDRVADLYRHATGGERLAGALP